MTNLILGDSYLILKTLAADSVDAVVTDPPYGLSFMNKHWDHDVPSVELWREVLRVLKPGGHVLSFGGTRTYHRMVVNIEDAGFEIRDQIQWIYGSGFPKSLDVSKAIDKAAGAEREIVGSTVSGKILRSNGNNERPYQQGQDRIECPVTAPATDLAKQWSGWGTALKPAFEPVVLARKPLTGEALLDSLVRECQQLLFARIVRTHSALNPNVKTRPSIVQWLAGNSTLTQDDLSEVMATLRFESENNSNLNTELSWLDILAEVSQLENTFTTEMASSLTTDLRILKSLPWNNTQVNMLPSEQRGERSSVSSVTGVLCAVTLKLETTRISSAQDLATRSVAQLELRPDAEPIVLARKPLIGTVAENVQKFGTGAINIDASRIGSDGGKPLVIETLDYQDKTNKNGSAKFRTKNVIHDDTVRGRSPANVLFDEEAAAVLDEQSGILKSGSKKPSMPNGLNNVYGANMGGAAGSIASFGGASRFFYVAKASKRERNAGLEGMPEKELRSAGGTTSSGKPTMEGRDRFGSVQSNNHPTVKPIKLMKYLVRLITPPGGTVLDPFMGSGTTGIAAKNLGFGFVGIERSEEYFEIAKRRI